MRKYGIRKCLYGRVQNWIHHIPFEPVGDLHAWLVDDVSDFLLTAEMRRRADVSQSSNGRLVLASYQPRYDVQSTMQRWLRANESSTLFLWFLDEWFLHGVTLSVDSVDFAM